MIELPNVGHEEGMNGSLDNEVEPDEPFNDFRFSTSVY